MNTLPKRIQRPLVFGLAIAVIAFPTLSSLLLQTSALADSGSRVIIMGSPLFAATGQKRGLVGPGTRFNEGIGPIHDGPAPASGRSVTGVEVNPDVQHLPGRSSQLCSRRAEEHRYRPCE